MAKRIGELLVSEGRISQEILNRALELQSFNERGLRLGGILVKWGLLEEEEVLEMLGRIHRCPLVGWKALSAADPEAVKSLSAAQAKRLKALPYAMDEKSLHVAFVNPSDLAAVDETTAITRKKVKPAVAMEVRIFQAHQQFYGSPISSGVWAVLQRLDRASKKRESGAHKNPDLDTLPPPIGQVATRKPLPDFSVPEDWLALLSPGRQAELDNPVPAEQEPLESGAAVQRLPDDPFSDHVSLTNFISEAIEFFDGMPNLKSDILDEPVEDLDPSTVETAPAPAPVPAGPDLNATTPSRSRRRTTGAIRLVSA